MEFICAEEKQWKEIKTIYMEAFPKRERKPYFALRHSVKTKKAVVMAATEGEQVLGFIVLIPYKDMVMADYLAVSSKVRSRGTGSYIMQNVCRQYKDMEVGSLVANSQYISMVLTSVMMLSLVIMMFPTSYACAKRIAEVLQTDSSIRGGKFQMENRPVRGTVEFRHVTFAYPGADEPILKDISFESRSGEVTAIIGGTGRGKSSILKLIPRLYDPMFGEVLIDGVNAKEYRTEDLRSLIGYVPQKNVLFSGDIADNLNFGNENGTEEDWKQAAKTACADEFICKKKEGYHDSVAQGGTNLSGGQRQRMAIARAMMKKPEIYVFDDSFSALDMKTDRQLRQNLKESIEDATVIMVAQRISTVLDADRILVVDDGQIVGNGTHRELLDTCPLYREIAEIQLGKEAL